MGCGRIRQDMQVRCNKNSNKKPDKPGEHIELPKKFNFYFSFLPLLSVLSVLSLVCEARTRLAATHDLYVRGVSIGEAGRKPNRESEKDRVTEEYVETTQHTHSLPHRLETGKKTTKKRVQQIFFHFLFRLRTKTQTQTQTDRNGLSALYFIHANFLLVEFFAPLPFPPPFCSRSSVELHKIRTERGKEMRETETHRRRKGQEGRIR